MGSQTEQIKEFKERLANVKPADIEDFFKFFEEQLEMNRAANNGTRRVNSDGTVEFIFGKSKYYREELRLDKLYKLVLILKS